MIKRKGNVMDTIIIKLPSLEEIFSRKPQVFLKIRENRVGEVPFAEKCVKKLNDCVNQSGIYIHICKEGGKRKVVYVGQTGDSFRHRLNGELTMENGRVSKRFREYMYKHIKKNDVYTIFFTDEEIAKMVSSTKESNNEIRRLLVEQAMVMAYNSKDLLNVHK